jgi:late competence protein required for DNA uptake (superfamily II DNA/RNA helicase)
VLENRVTKQYLSTCLQKKLSKSDLETALAKKADVNDLELIINSLEMKASVPTIEKLTQILENKADKSDIMIISSEKRHQHEEAIEKLNNLKSHFEVRIG